MKFVIPPEVLQQHTAVVGKTGSGKTSTEKLMVEQAVAEGYRVCVLDTTKSDWWGITSSADGKHPGLPFRILGGPRGHLPLHSSAGKAIGEIVGSGKLPLSIIDMADFEAGGIQRFFVDFAPALMRSAKGVIYLVIEEAHELAPKERAGFGAENMAIHWAKKLATAGRSKGIRLIVATQRVQALHNAILGSCETMIAHRLSTPADKEPVVKWLRGHTDKETAASIESSMASLKTGTGWICSGEAGLFKCVTFPKFATFDNTVTPTRDGGEISVKTAPVDQEELRAIIGDAVKEAEENDPKVLRARLATAIKALEAASAKQVNPAARVDPESVRQAEVRGYERGRADMAQAMHDAGDEISDINKHLPAIRDKFMESLTRLGTVQLRLYNIADGRTKAKVQRQQSSTPSSKTVTLPFKAGPIAKLTAGAVHGLGSPDLQKLMPRAFLTALAQHPEGLTKGQILVHTEYRSSGPVSKCFAELTRQGWVESNLGKMTITPGGLAALGTYQPLPTGEALREHLLNGSKLAPMEKKLLRATFEAYPNAIGKGRILEQTGYASSGPVSKAFARLVALGYVTADGRGALRAAAELFQ